MSEVGLKGKSSLDFPGGSVEKIPRANVGDAGSIPGPGRFHMPGSNWTRALQLLSLCARAQKLQLWSPRAHALQQEKPPQWEAWTPQLESSLCFLQLEKDQEKATKTQHSWKLKKKKKRQVYLTSLLHYNY